MKLKKILSDVSSYYTEKINSHGATARGVDWNSTEAQETRFNQLLKVCDDAKRLTINDYGCGYGALLDYIFKKIPIFEYSGFDISEAMIARAVEIHKNIKNCIFFSEESFLRQTDYTVASGVFNVKLKTSNKEWLEYILYSLKNIAKVSRKGFSFNMLSEYSDREYMREDLYYADPCYFFNYCKTRFSKSVSLLHNYGLYEFTIIVQK